MIEGKNLTYKYGFGTKNAEINNVSVEIKKGYLTCLLGHNGAGKTTLLKLLNGQLLPKEGEVYVNGQKLTKKALNEVRKHVAYVSSSCVLFNDNSCKFNKELLEALCVRFNDEEFNRILEKFGFDMENLNAPIKELSTGERMQFQIALQLSKDTEYVIMDEPFANLDPVVKERIMEVLHEKITKDNVGICLSTHLIDEIDDETDYVIMIDDGVVKESGDRETLFEKYGVTDLKSLFRKIGK